MRVEDIFCYLLILPFFLRMQLTESFFWIYRCFNQFRCWQTWPVSYFFREAWIGISGAWQFRKWKGLTWIVKSERLEEVLFQLATSVKPSIFKYMLETFTAFYVEVLFTFLGETSWTVSVWVRELDSFKCMSNGWMDWPSVSECRQTGQWQKALKLLVEAQQLSFLDGHLWASEDVWCHNFRGW